MRLTTLHTTISNDNIPKIGELAVQFRTGGGFDDNRFISLRAARECRLSIAGNGYFTDAGRTRNLGPYYTLSASDTVQKLYVSNGDFTVRIPDKYALYDLVINYLGQSDPVSPYIAFDLGQLYGCAELRNLSIGGPGISGDIDALKTCGNLTNMRVSSTNIYGDISAFKDLAKFMELNISGTDGHDGIHGDLDYLNNLPVGNVLGLRFLNNVYGDISMLQSRQVASEGANPPMFRWGRTRPSGYNILSLWHVRLDDVDRMLNNQAQCKAYIHPSNPYMNAISVYGPRTSASDSAVTTLKSKGYAVTVNGTNL